VGKIAILTGDLCCYHYPSYHHGNVRFRRWKSEEREEFSCEGRKTLLQ
jgi:hypothetical protein